jgi:hypothetical protein
MTAPRKWPTAGDWALFAIVIFIFLIALGMCGCKSTTKMPRPECEQEIVTVKEPVPCIIPIAELDPAELPPYPPFPGHDADEAELKDWAVRFGEVAEQREAVWAARDEAWQAKVASHNADHPKCSDVAIH